MAKLSVPMLQTEQTFKRFDLHSLARNMDVDEVEVTQECSICQTCKKGVSGIMNSLYIFHS